MNALTKIEPIALPDARRPTRIPSLPGWLASQQNAMATNLQMDRTTGTFRDLVTLPAAMLPSDAQRVAIEGHIRSLRSLLDLTPENSEDADKATLAAVTKMLMVKPAAKTSEAAAEARGDAYMAALDDVPYWGVEAAIRNWYRGDCGKDEKGRPYDYNWAPEPHALRRLAIGATWSIRKRVEDLQPLLTAVAYVDCSAELERGQAAMRGLFRTMGDTEKLRSLTFDEAVRIGNETPKPAGEQPAPPPATEAAA